MNKVTITDKDFDCKDDIYTDWYKCPKCGESMIIVAASYCQECGVKLEWDLSGKREKSL